MNRQNAVGPGSPGRPPRALFRLGDTVYGLGRRTLESYLDDPRRAYANHARMVFRTLRFGG